MDQEFCDHCNQKFQGTSIEWSVYGPEGEKHIGMYCSFDCLNEVKEWRNENE